MLPIFSLGPLLTQAKSRDHVMVRAQKRPKPVPTHLQHHVMLSWTVYCSVKSYVTGPSTKCYFNEISIYMGPHT